MSSRVRPSRRRLPAPPPRRARRAPWRDAAYLSLDFETTGLDRSADRIVSFGAVPVIGGAARLADTRHEAVDPGERTVSRVSVTIHRIRPVDLVGAMSMAQAADELAALLERRFLVAWYAPVEAGVLGSLFGVSDARWLRRTIDVRDLVAVLDGVAAAAMSLTAVAGAYGVPVSDPHQALDDALVTAQLFLVAASRLDARDGPRSARDLLALTRSRTAAGRHG